ncbi:MAG: hypothetical protein HN350_19465 [Phycisphaerales bacterium]|jgi:hypothetical protein|nr:hypothetical protein [Phycisphaerales bacterium]
MIQAKCPSCQSVVQGPERLAGKKVQCSKCQTIFQFPAAAAPAPAPAAQPAAARPTAPQPAAAARPTAPQPAAAPAPSQSKPTKKASASKTRKPAKSKGGNKKLVMFGGIGLVVVALVVLGVFVVPGMFGGASTAVIERYASADTFAVGTIDIQNIVNSDLYEKLGLDKQLNDIMAKEIQTTLKPADFLSITLVFNKPKSGDAEPEPTVVLSLARDVTLKDIVGEDRAKLIEKFQGIEYILEKPGVVLAKTEPSAVCVIPTGGMKALAGLMARLKSDKPAELNEKLLEAMKPVLGQSSFFAAYIPDSMKGKLPNNMAALASMKAVGFGFSVGSDVDLKLVAELASENEAKEASQGFGMIQAMGVGAMQGKASGAKDPDVKAVFTAVANTLNNVKLEQEGANLTGSLSVVGGDIVLIKNNFMKAVSALMGDGGTSSGGGPLDFLKMFGG